MARLAKFVKTRKPRACPAFILALPELACGVRSVSLAHFTRFRQALPQINSTPAATGNPTVSADLGAALVAGWTYTAQRAKDPVKLSAPLFQSAYHL